MPSLKALWQQLAEKAGVRPLTLAVLVTLALLFTYLQEITDSMEGFINVFKRACQ